MDVEIRPAGLEDVRRLRQLVLRPHQRAQDIVFEHDADPDALHLGAFEGVELVAVASVAREPPTGEDDPDAWRVRGMATIPERRGRGIGGALLERLLAHARERGGRLVWLNARTGAVAFYERHGFVAAGGVFELPDIGPHRELRLELR